MPQLHSQCLHPVAPGPRPTRARQPPAAGHLQAWCPSSGYAVPLEEASGKELAGPSRLWSGDSSSAPEATGDGAMPSPRGP